MPDFGDIGPWIASGAALVQVWAIAAWKRLRHGEVGIYESDNVQVGSGVQGPCVALTGTLTATRKDVFIKRIEAVVTRKKDNATHRLQWSRFLSGTRWLGALGSPRNDQMEPVWSFLLRTTDSLRYSIFFIDPAFVAERRPRLDHVRRLWFEFARERVGNATPTGETALVPASEVPPTVDVLFQEFGRGCQPVIDLYADLERSVFWLAGEYSVEMRVECAQPDRSYSKRWDIVLTDDDFSRMRGNSLEAIREACGLQGRYAFAWPEYRRSAA